MRASIVIAPRPIGRFALFRSALRFLRVEAALFAATDTAMRPQAFENHLRSGGSLRLVFAAMHAELAHMVQQSLISGKLLVPLGRGDNVRDLQFAAEFKPLRDRLKVDIAKMLGEDAANRCANQFASNGFRALQFTFIFEFEFAGDGRQSSVEIGDAGDAKRFAGAGGALFGAADRSSSSVVMGRRWLTPERLSTRLSSRAWNAISSTTSRR